MEYSVEREKGGEGGVCIHFPAEKLFDWLCGAGCHEPHKANEVLMFDGAIKAGEVHTTESLVTSNKAVEIYQ